eukprot:2941687-Lingulodinium_polyedra.AAC.1
MQRVPARSSLCVRPFAGRLPQLVFGRAGMPRSSGSISAMPDPQALPREARGGHKFGQAR